MRCINCGFESEANFEFCPNCGRNMGQDTIILNEDDKNRLFANNKLLALAKDSHFLVICILLSVLVGLSVISENFDIIKILILIFAWIFFANGRKGSVDIQSARNISGTVYALYIINYVAVGIAFLGSCLSAYSINNADFNKGLTLDILEEYGLDKYYGLVEFIMDFPFILVIGGAAITVIGLIFNIFGWQNIHTFIKSVYHSAVMGKPDYKCPKAARNWLIFFGIWEFVSAVLAVISTSRIDALFVPAISMVLQIMGAMLIDKHFIKA